MDIFYSSHFARSYKKLPKSIKDIAEEREKIFRKNWQDPLLNTHKLKGKFSRLYAFSINNKYRIIFETINENTFHFHEVGDHDIYK